MEKYKPRLSLNKPLQQTESKRAESRLMTLKIKPTKQEDIQEDQNLEPTVNLMLLKNQYNKKTRPSILLNIQNKLHFKTEIAFNQDNKNSFDDIKLSHQKSLGSLFSDKKWYYKHPYRQLVSQNVDKLAFKRFLSSLYKGALYSGKFLKGPSEKYLASKQISLPQFKQYRKKFLILDLDQTLIHSTQNRQKTDVVLKIDELSSISFNIRPYCYQFLEKMTEYFAIYVFTASTPAYANPIIDHLNKKIKTIQGVLARPHCMETRNGFFIKDLRIIKNRGLKDMIIVDNLVHSFGLQLQNGIPILEFTNDPKDQQLRHIQTLLLQLKDLQDVRPYLQSKLKIRKISNMSQKQFDI